MEVDINAMFAAYVLFLRNDGVEIVHPSDA